ncbi:hypothetical protein OU995_16615 [Roseateles sp. SL47]|uniref:hypothetical protein n=1 Tax=Roseateles sp. SL47 TaxID=2995138 RepID=UPI0022708D8D|nr:hypothetical protein [Roseateles sp. SL47]WAC71212.1 hypothetical protein OU995_16615 [Roseateles sp. SL47]
MHDLFEIGFREALSDEALADFLSIHFHLSKECIVSEDEYWAEAWEGKERIGISVQAAADGLKANLSGVCFRALDDIALGNMAAEAASKLGSEAVVGDYRKHGAEAQGSFLVYFPDGSVWEAVDASRGSVSDVKVLRQI